MDVLETLSVALGLATLAGINLYLTVFVTGLAVHFGWVALPGQLAELSVLGHPWIIAISGVLYFLQFFADKIPWIDTANDAVHTFIRPIGGALLAVLALGDASPIVKVIAALVAGGAALTSHSAKAGARLFANASPEPVSNIGLSVGEDAVVLGGLGLLVWNPVVAVILAVVVLAVIWMLLPRLLRNVRAISWLAWCKLNSPAAGTEPEEFKNRLPRRCEDALRGAFASNESVAFAVPCLSGSGPRLSRNHFGWLVRLSGGKLFFVGRRWRGPFVIAIPPVAEKPVRESRFLCEKLVLSAGGETYTFNFERGLIRMVDHVVTELGAQPSAPVEKEPALVG